MDAGWKKLAEAELAHAIKQFAKTDKWAVADKWLEVIRTLTPLVLADSSFRSIQREIVGAICDTPKG